MTAVSLSCWLFGLRPSSTSACRLVDRARSWCQNSHFLEHTCWSVFPGASATSVLSSREPQPAHTSPGGPPRPGWVCPRLPWSSCFVLGPRAREASRAPSRSGAYLPKSCGAPAPKPCWPSKPNALGVPAPVINPQAGKSDVELRTVTLMGTPLW